MNVLEAAEKVGAPENPADAQKVPPFFLLWNTPQEDGTSKAFDLRQNFSIEGWMIFEAPKDLRFREIRWRAGDSLTIPFWPG